MDWWQSPPLHNRSAMLRILVLLSTMERACTLFLARSCWLSVLSFSLRGETDETTSSSYLSFPRHGRIARCSYGSFRAYRVGGKLVLDLGEGVSMSDRVKPGRVRPGKSKRRLSVWEWLDMDASDWVALAAVVAGLISLVAVSM
jgi:hypothetical protein